MRSEALTRVIEHAAEVVANASAVSTSDAEFADAVFRAVALPCELPNERREAGGLRDLPAGAFFEDAIRSALAFEGPTADLAAAIRDVAHELQWERRVPTRTDPDGFSDGHANAILVGPGGMERAGDVTIGVSLMAPNVRYPDHRHAPEELYVVLSRGQWRQSEGRWHEPGPGGVVFHAPGVVHSMRSGDSPLLALWLLRPSPRSRGVRRSDER